MLRGLKNKFSPSGNIHFGKIVLVLVMIFTMIFGSFNVVQASGDLYYYEKYTTSSVYESYYVSELSGYALSNAVPSDIYLVHGYDYYPYYEDVGVNLDTNTGIFTAYGPRKAKLGEMGYRAGTAYYVMPNGNRYVSIQGDEGYGEIIGHEYGSRESGKRIGNLIEIIIGTSTEYPIDGIHTDSNWYIRKGIANNSPILSISTPGVNSYFSK